MCENYYFIEKMAQIKAEEILHDMKQDCLVPMVNRRRKAQGFRVLLSRLVNHIIRRSVKTMSRHQYLNL